MRYIIIDSCIKPKKTDILHFLLFHGSLYPKEIKHKFGIECSEPLLVAKGGRHWAEIILPTSALIVSENIKNLLAGISNIQYCDVSFSKLIDMDFPIGDFSYYKSMAFLKDPYSNRSDKIFENHNDCRALHELIPCKYHEMVIPCVADVENDPRSIKVFNLEIPYLATDETEVQFCTKMADKYPLYFSGPIVIQRDFFDKIARFFDLNFFTYVEFDF